MGGGAGPDITPPPPPHPNHPPRALKKPTTGRKSKGKGTRKSAAADGKSCLYADNAGAEVTLRLISLASTDPRAALAPLEAELRAELPRGANSAGPKATDDDRVDIDLPGIHIHADGKDNANVNVGGASVNAHDHAGQADKSAVVTVGQAKPGAAGVTVNARDSGAEIHVDEPGSGVRLTVVLVSDTAGPNGYKLAGYEARGPSDGPLAVASVKAKSEEHDDLYHDMGKLLERNVGR